MKYNYNVDLIRLIAVFLITFTHTRHHLNEGFVFYMIEIVPKYGTLILSIISGYFYWKVSKSHKNLLNKKVRSLLIPYLLANILVLIPVLILNYAFNIDFLNRLEFGHQLITEGILSMNSAPINPPTYFVRDIFIIFVMIELITKRNFYTLLILIPLAIWGDLLIRPDILVLFAVGVFLANFKEKISRNHLIFSTMIVTIILFFLYPNFIRYALAILIFLVLIDLDIHFVKTGGYSYLLHLYHSPVLVISFPIISRFVANQYLSLLLQITTAVLSVYGLYLITRKYEKLRILSGGR